MITRHTTPVVRLDAYQQFREHILNKYQLDNNSAFGFLWFWSYLRAHVPHYMAMVDSGGMTIITIVMHEFPEYLLQRTRNSNLWFGSNQERVLALDTCIELVQVLIVNNSATGG